MVVEALLGISSPGVVILQDVLSNMTGHNIIKLTCEST